jgi:hypothetical protein
MKTTQDLADYLNQLPEDDHPLARYCFLASLYTFSCILLSMAAYELYGNIALWLTFLTFSYFFIFDVNVFFQDGQARDTYVLFILFVLFLLVVSSTYANLTLMTLLFESYANMKPATITKTKRKYYNEYLCSFLLVAGALFIVSAWFTLYYQNTHFLELFPENNQGSLAWQLLSYAIKLVLTVFMGIMGGYSVYAARLFTLA